MMPYGDRFLLTLDKVRACCLTAPSPYLNQCWLTISEVQWQTPAGNFKRTLRLAWKFKLKSKYFIVSTTSGLERWGYYDRENELSEISFHFPRCQWVNELIFFPDRPNPPSGEPCISTITGTSLTVSWYGPSYDGGSCITDYRVEVAQADTMEWRTLTSSCKVTRS